MRSEHLNYLACPACQGELTLRGEHPPGAQVEQGDIDCRRCAATYPLVRGIPRFVPGQGYTGSFGHQWLIHARTQFDSHTGARHSEERFFAETGWPRRLEGETILEVGCGAGRFTEQALKTGAMVVSLDYSAAVEANYAAHRDRPDLLVIQADLYRPPLRPGSFSRLFCFGVLQHTPDPERAFRSLPPLLEPGGRLAVDVYRAPENLRNRLFATKYWARHVTKRIPAERLYPAVRRYVELMWPVSGVINRVAGNWVNWLLLVQDYRGMYDLPEEDLKEWAILDSFDALSPRYDQPQSLETVRRWFAEAGLDEVDVRYGYNGIEGRGLKR